MKLIWYIKNGNMRLVNKYMNKIKIIDKKILMCILDNAIVLKNSKMIRLILSNQNINNIDNLLDIIIDYNDDQLLYIYQNELNIDWNIILSKYKNRNKYNNIIKLIANKKLIIDIKNMDNELFKNCIIEENKINMDILDIIITKNLDDKIMIYCEYGRITESLIEILLEKYNKYDLYYFLKNIKNITDRMIELIIKMQKSEYIKIIKDNLSHENINRILEYSLLYNYQYGIDMAICYNANYILVLDKIMKI
jgi:malate/lactate dehydrogenase